MTEYTTKELILIWLDSFLGLEYKHKKELYKYIGDKTEIKSLINQCKEYIVSQVGEGEFNTLINSANNVYLNFVVSELKNKNVKAITIDSEDYPATLLETNLPPLVLYAKGDLSLLESERFGMVGSRKSLPMQVNLAKSFAESLSKAGFTLVTGIAEGVDSAVIESALSSKGKVISVIAGGFDNIYPSSNLALSERIIENGLLLSEYPPQTVPKPFHFPVRNRIIAGLSSGVLVVSAGKKSGTLYTAEYAEEYGKMLFAIPYSVNVPSGVGCNNLIKLGARLVTEPTDILEIFDKTESQEEVSLSAEEGQIIDLLSEKDTHIEEICSKLNKAVFEISPLLSMLEIKGKVVKNGNNIFGIRR